MKYLIKRERFRDKNSKPSATSRGPTPERPQIGLVVLLGLLPQDGSVRKSSSCIDQKHDACDLWCVLNVNHSCKSLDWRLRMTVPDKKALHSLNNIYHQVRILTVVAFSRIGQGQNNKKCVGILLFRNEWELQLLKRLPRHDTCHRWGRGCRWRHRLWAASGVGWDPPGISAKKLFFMLDRLERFCYITSEVHDCDRLIRDHFIIHH